MKILHQHLTMGVAIIFIGLVLLLHNIGVFYLDEQLIWGLGLIILGGIFLRVYQRKSRQKIVLIFGILILIIGLFILLDEFFYIPDGLIGSLFLWTLAAMFISIFIHNNHRWWAILPAGILLVLGFIVALDAFRLLQGEILWFIFLAGISLIFWFLYLIKDDVNHLSWALFPAFLVTIFSFFILSLIWENQLSEILFPTSIIFCGAYLVIRNMMQQTPTSPNSERD